jgi:hypothetical protein
VGAKLEARVGWRLVQGRERDMAGDGNDTVELECPICGARVETSVKDAETGKIRCPRGHEFDVMGILGGGMTPSATSASRKR